MLVPGHIRLANHLLASSKVSHDFAIDLATHATEFVYTSDMHEPVRTLVLDAVGQVLLYGDQLGNLFVQLYVWLISGQF